YKTTQYGCYPSNQWSSHDFDVTVFLANVAGEGVYPMYDISGPANDATSSYDNKTYIYLQLASNEAHTLYEVDSNYGLTSVIEVTDVNTNELTFFYHPVSDHTSTTRYIALPSRIDATVFVDLLSNDGMENDSLALDHVASLVTIVDDVNALLAAGTSVSFEVLNVE
ncbi:hypothetical protein, partial [Photobacterium angustum]